MKTVKCKYTHGLTTAKLKQFIEYLVLLAKPKIKRETKERNRV